MNGIHHPFMYYAGAVVLALAGTHPAIETELSSAGLFMAIVLILIGMVLSAAKLGRALDSIWKKRTEKEGN